MREFFSESVRKYFIFGGQRGTAFMETKRNSDRKASPISVNPEIKYTRYVKWILISPAFFKHGWIPGWINMPHNGEKSYKPELEIGRVLLKVPVLRNSMTRDEWRFKLNSQPVIQAKLVAARIPKPVCFSGWKLDPEKDNAGGTPKATKLLVPAGAVYYFECDNKDEAVKLAAVLNGNTKSDMYGEHGFGLGVCSTWEPESV